MERDELRAVQDPLKARHRAEPDAALVTLKADGTLGDGMHLCSGDMLPEALAACAG
ncbi:MAG: hypothetical protein WDA60_05060 [Acidimicrobiia bacterium]|jgi:hypothetical protein